MMESVDYHDRHLDSPEYPHRGQCDGCGEDFDEGDLTRTGTPGLYRWLCVTCLDELDQMEDEE